MATITIGGKKLEGRSITIVVGRELVEHDRVGEGESFVIQVEGDLAILNANQSVVMQGDVHGSVHAGNNVTCDSVSGDVTAGGDVTCKTIGGGAKAGGTVDSEDESDDG